MSRFWKIANADCTFLGNARPDEKEHNLPPWKTGIGGITNTKTIRMITLPCTARQVNPFSYSQNFLDSAINTVIQADGFFIHFYIYRISQWNNRIMVDFHTKIAIQL